MTEHLPSFRRWLVSRGYSHGTARIYTTTIGTFYRRNGEEITTESLEACRRRLRAGCRSVLGVTMAALGAWCLFLAENRLAEGLPPVPTPTAPEEDRRFKSYRGPDAPRKRGRPFEAGRKKSAA